MNFGYITISDAQWNINSSNSPQVNSQNLNALIDMAIQCGTFNILVDVDITVDDAATPITRKTEVFFYDGGGSITGMYRRDLIKCVSVPNVRIDNGLSSDGMAAFYNANAPTVVIMGDSISTDGPNATSMADSMASVISKSISRQNKNASINFINRSIGGQTWLGANAKPTAFPYWYQDTTKDWLDYVKLDSPDLLILAFGMNDANGFNAGALHSVINKINLWSKVPSILFVTNAVPSMATTYNSGAGFCSSIYQDGRDWAAGYSRSYARFYGYSILDINRQICLLRDGRDYISVPLSRVGVYNQSYIHDSTIVARDFSISGMLASGSWAPGRVMLLKVGCGSLDIVYITNSAGFYKITAFCEGDHVTPYVSVTTSVSVTYGQVLDISIQNNYFTFFSGSSKVIAFSVIRTGGITPIIAEWQDAPGGGPFVSVTVNAGDYLQCAYTLRDSDIWGHDDGTSATKIPEGGNGINHYSSKGIELIVSPVVEAFDFRRKAIEMPSSISSLNSGVTAKTAITATRHGSQVTLSGRLSCPISPPYKLFTLPSLLAPSQQKIVSTACVGAGTWQLGVLDIRTDGTVNIAYGSAADNITLDGVTFII